MTHGRLIRRHTIWSPSTRNCSRQITAMELPISCKEVITSIDRFDASHCGKEEVWTGTQQKWWYEVAKEFAYSTADRCRVCRRKKREQSAESRRVHLEGS